MPANYTFRPVNDNDIDFLLELYATTRSDIQQLIDWSPAQKANFIRMQFEAQHLHYKTHFPNTRFSVILDSDDRRIGRYYLCLATNEVRVIDIAILPAHQRQRIGSAIITETMEKSRVAKLPLRLHVEKTNPALNWYLQMGFNEIEETDYTLHLEWEPTHIHYQRQEPIAVRR